ncbi:hypothetical protein [Erythrobacter sp. JK5]|uniref:hypothetical protein n=1 Tax=Erythrobacter sp. JK5 TaxID=2829500 RepID=UPI001BA88FA1|nr:hypothetical protein [Erythrobacter sp. JK5]QUL37370.1 hypothetical protein KDC96_13520 [Erythrobacter sp. JK5]
MSEQTLEFRNGHCVTEGQHDLEKTDDCFRCFTAIQDVPPQKTLFLSVDGEILIGNPGIDVELTYAVPQGINPHILILRADLIQKPGFWPQVMTWKPARYRSGMVQDGQYAEVQIMAPFGDHTVKVTERQ